MAMGKLNYGSHLLKSDDPNLVAQGVSLLTEAAESGQVKAQTTLGLLYVQGDLVERDLGRSFHYFQAASEGGDEDGIIGLGMSYLNGYGCQKDGAKAVELFELAASMGSAQAQFNAAWHYQVGAHVDVDHDRAIALVP
jgi:TPR repeat protein